MIKSAFAYPISQLFSPDSTLVYKIPKYQREYTWGQDQWQSLFDDILENDRGYFLGSLICINDSDDTMRQFLEVIDGQQRLTTLSLFMAALYKALNNFELDDDQKNEAFNLKRKIVGKNNLQRVIPQTQGGNADDYKYILKECGLIPNAIKPRNIGNRRICKAFRYLEKRVGEHLETNGGSKIKKAFEVVDKINEALLVKIEVDTHSDAYTLFESLNNRGVPLTAVDLMKNSLLSRAEKGGGSVDDCFEKWQEIIADLGDDYSDQERFFRYYYNAFKEDLKTYFEKPPKSFAPVATKSNMLRIYDELIKKNPERFLKDLAECTKYYALFLLKEDEENPNNFSIELTDLKNSQGSPAYLLLLYIFRYKDNLGLSDANIKEIILYLAKFFVRRNLTDTPNTRNLTRLFMDIISNINGIEKSKIVEYICQSLREKSASDEYFEEKLRGNIYEDNVGVTRYILCSLAQRAMTRETFVDLWQYQPNQKKNIYLWTIEHIFPQGENIKKCWVDMMASGDESLAKQLQADHVHKLGNLTISAFNSNLGDKDFTTKRDRTDGNGNYIGYRNGLSLNQDLKEATEWSVQAIEERGEKLLKQILLIFSLN